MAYSKSTLAYGDCKEIMERALSSANGLSLSFETRNMAIRFKQRCHYYRVLNRKENLSVYPEPSHEMHGRSPFDTLFIRLKQGDETTVLLEIIKAENMKVTEL